MCLPLLHILLFANIHLQVPRDLSSEFQMEYPEAQRRRKKIPRVLRGSQEHPLVYIFATTRLDAFMQTSFLPELPLFVCILSHRRSVVLELACLRTVAKELNPGPSCHHHLNRPAVVVLSATLWIRFHLRESFSV